MSNSLTDRLRARMAFDENEFKALYQKAWYNIEPSEIELWCAKYGHVSLKYDKAPLIERLICAVEALEGMIKQCDFASEILTLTHPELSNVEMNTLTTRQYMLWSRSAKSDAVEQARDALAKLSAACGEGSK